MAFDINNASVEWELLADGRCLPMTKIMVDFSMQYNRQLHPEFEDQIKKLWESKINENKRLYNMSKFRLKSASTYTTNEAMIHLNIGLTDYRDTVCTNHLSSLSELHTFGEQTYDDVHACFGDAIGVGGIVVTEDNFIILQKRSDWVAESKGCFDTPGGHAEPEEMIKKLSTTLSDVFNIKSEDVVFELFHSFIREVRDEVNVPESSLSWPLLLAITRNKVYGSKPGMIFYVKCSLPKQDVEKLYFKGGPETDESTQLKFLHAEELLNNQDLAKTNDLAPLCSASLLLYIHHYQTLKNM